ncbi:MAG: hypothetical protein AAB602_01580 [Patescibacteria group bacterium]
MITDAVLRYIKDSLAAGKTEEVITATLINAGWKPDDVMNALASVKNGQPSPVTSPVANQTASQSDKQTPQAQQSESAKMQSGAEQPSVNPRGPMQAISQRTINPEPQKSRKGVALGIIVGILVLAIGGVAAAQYAGIIQIPFLSALTPGPDPEKLFENVFTKSQEIQSRSYAFDLSVKSEAKDSDAIPIVDVSKESNGRVSPMTMGALDSYQIDFAIHASGAWDKNAPLNGDGRFRISIDVQAVSMSGKTDFEFLKKGDVYYVQLHDLQLPMIFAAIGNIPNFSTITNKWIKITQDDIKQLQVMGLRVPGIASQQLPDDAKRKELTDQTQKIARFILQIIQEERVLWFEETPNIETLGEVKVFHYAIKIQGDKIPIIYRRIVTEFSGDAPLGMTPLKFDQKVSDYLAGEDFQGIMDRLNANMQLETWIETTAGFPVKWLYGLRFLPTTESKTQLRLAGTSEITDINKPVTVDEPKDYISAQDALSKLNVPRNKPSLNTTARNPLDDIEILKEARDTQRISNLSTLKALVSLYAADVSNPKLCTAKTIYASAPNAPVPAGWKQGANAGKLNMDGTGWLPMDFTEISSGSPLEELPKDPINDARSGLAYTYACDPATQTFKFSVKLESKKYNKDGKYSVTATDGGIYPDAFEIGTNLKIHN